MTLQNTYSDHTTAGNDMRWSGGLNDEIEESDVNISDTDDPQASLPNVNSRHQCLTQTDLDNISSLNDKSTTRQTNWAMNTFKDWLLERNHPTDFEYLPAVELSILLRQFYGEVKTARRQEYSKSAFQGLRAGLQRYISNPPFNRNINIITDGEFKPANKVIMGRILLNKKLGLDVKKQRVGIHHDDIVKMYQSGTLNNTTAKGLQFKVFFETCLHFNLRGRRLRNLTKDSFAFHEDSNGVTYATAKLIEPTDQGLDSKRDEKERRMYATASKYCPIESLHKYLSLLDPDSPYFYQHISSEIQLSEYLPAEYWYNGRPVGVNTLVDFMKNISIEAKLSQTYSNLCIRPTDFSDYLSATTYRTEKPSSE